jgi:hypothetical protein
MSAWMCVSSHLGVVALATSALAAEDTKPSAPEPGIYAEQAQGASTLVKLETSEVSRTGTKDLGKTMATTMLTGGMLGGKPKVALIFQGERASLRVPAQAAFHFYFDLKPASAVAAGPKAMDPAAMMAAMMEQTAQGDSGMPAGVQHPNGFVLIRLLAEKGERQLVASMDMKPKDPIAFRVRSLPPQGYRVFVDRPLGPGEYAFFAPPKQDGTGGAGDRIWDFGVDGK